MCRIELNFHDGVLFFASYFRIDADPDTSSSFYDDSDASLPQSPVSDNNLRHSEALAPYTPLRVARSAEILTPTTRRKFFYHDNKDSEKTRRKSDLERPQFHLVIENSPSPPEVRKTPRITRGGGERQTLPRENSSPEIFTTRPHSVHMERPHSEIYTTAKSLTIPSPDFMRLCSDSYRSNSSLNTPSSRSDSFSRERKSTSTPRVTSSIQRPLNFNRSTPEGENEWQKDRWRQWDNVTSQKPGDVFEQETLV